MDGVNVKNKVVELNLNDIMPNRFQPRIKFSEEPINELASSIREHGVIQPIVVRPLGSKYEIIAGERRYKASQIAGKTTIPAIIMDLNDKDSAEIALIENIQRKDLTPIEEAISYKKILDMGNLTQDGLAEKLGKKQSTVSNKLRLLNLSDEVQEALLEDQISERHARSLLKLPTEEMQNNMLDRIINERLTVRATDQAIQSMISPDTNKEVKEEDKIYDINALIKDEKKGDSNMNNMFSEMPSSPIVDDNSTPNNNFAPAVEVPNNNFASNIEMPNNSFSLNNIDTNNNVDFNNFGQNSQTNEPQGNKFFNMFNLNLNEDMENTKANMDFGIFNDTPMDTNNNISTPDFNSNFNSNLSSNDDAPEIMDFSFDETPINDAQLPIDNPDYMNENKADNKYVAGDLKAAINTIRDSVSTIEKYGYRIDCEEFDLEDYYQIVIKIEK